MGNNPSKIYKKHESTFSLLYYNGCSILIYILFIIVQNHSITKILIRIIINLI